MTNRQIFLQHIGQTSSAPLALEIIKASGVKLRDINGKEYLDLIAGISVCNVGHCHPDVVKAVQLQAAEYMHLLVYGELVQSPQVAYAKMLTDHLPSTLNCVYFTNSGTEATEGAMKLAKRVTGRTNIIAFNKSYHGSTQGALSVIGDEYWRNSFRPLLPGVYHYDYNSFDVLNAIDQDTACVILETVQAESGIIKPSEEWIQAIRTRCTEVHALLILDEVQAGFGRTGSLWAFEQFDVVPDILLLGKALGGGMPLGAFVAHVNLMNAFTNHPVLGHITTFGGHPVSCAAGLASMKVLLDGDYIKQVKFKEGLFAKYLEHSCIKQIRSAGLWISVQFDSFKTCKKIIDRCIENGVLSDWFLFAPDCLRIAPPLIITEEEIRKACSIIIQSIEA